VYTGFWPGTTAESLEAHRVTLPTYILMRDGIGSRHEILSDVGIPWSSSWRTFDCGTALTAIANQDVAEPAALPVL
jgi:hypothetical protein